MRKVCKSNFKRVTSTSFTLDSFVSELQLFVWALNMLFNDFLVFSWLEFELWLHKSTSPRALTNCRSNGEGFPFNLLWKIIPDSVNIKNHFYPSSLPSLIKTSFLFCVDCLMDWMLEGFLAPHELCAEQSFVAKLFSSGVEESGKCCIPKNPALLVSVSSSTMKFDHFWRLLAEKECLVLDSSGRKTRDHATFCNPSDYDNLRTSPGRNKFKSSCILIEMISTENLERQSRSDDKNFSFI